MNRIIVAVLLAAFSTGGGSALVARAQDTPAVPIYPGAVPAERPAGVGFKTPPPSAKTYATPDSFAKVKVWYQAHLNGAQEFQQAGMQETEDAFVIGSVGAGTVVMIQSYNGKTWIVIGPPL